VFDSAFSIDEHENIRVMKLPEPNAAGVRRFATSCAGALGQPWQTWRNKKPRADLPGDPTRPTSKSMDGAP
jgi:hypothetical protein